jgi:hypothetical protein
VRDRVSGAGLSGVRIQAVETTSGARAETETDAAGTFVLDRTGPIRASDVRTGLPAGSWRVAAETTMVEDPILTPALQPTIVARALSRGRVEVEWALPASVRWSYEVDRDDTAVPVRIAGGDAAIDGDGVLRAIDEPPDGVWPVRYRLRAWIAGTQPSAGFETFSGWLEFSVQDEASAAWHVRAYPLPWNGQSPVRVAFLRDGGPASPGEIASATRLRILSAAGRTVAGRELNAGTTEIVWDGRDASGRTVPSGVYLLHWEEAGGRWARARAKGLLLLIR